MLNCWPNCLAIVKRGKMQDKLLRCTDLVKLNGEPYWKFEPLSYGLPDHKTQCIKDSALRPIHNPPEAMRDQTLFWKPIPTLSERITGALNKLKYGGKS